MVVMRRTRDTLRTSTGVDGEEEADAEDEFDKDGAREGSIGELMEQCGGGEKRNVCKSSPRAPDVCLFRGPGELIIENASQ